VKNNQTKKELQAQYKEREVVGGVYVIRNISDNKLFLDSTTDLQGTKNRFEFAKSSNLCVHLKIQADWGKRGSDSFVYEVLEELKKGAAQSSAEFKAEIDILKEMWAEKLKDEQLY